MKKLLAKLYMHFKGKEVWDTKMSEPAARKAVKESFLFEALQQTPEVVMHDSVNASTDDVYSEYIAAEMRKLCTTEFTEKIYSDFAESRASYERGEYEDFDDALDEISEKYGL